MKLGWFVAAKSVLLGLIALSPQNASADGSQPPLTVEPSVRKTMTSVVAVTPKSTLKRLQLSVEYPSRPSMKPSEIESRYEPLGNNMWGVISTLKRVDGTIAQQIVSVCGMFDALSVLAANFSIEQISILPIGKGLLFVPFGMKTSIANDSVTKLTRLDVEPKALCSPSSGSSFDYLARSDTQYTASVGFGSINRTVAVTHKAHCDAIGRTSASTLNAKLKGDYLEVNCTGTTDAGKAWSRKFAYLIDSALYVYLETQTELSLARYTILDAEYEN